MGIHIRKTDILTQFKYTHIYTKAHIHTCTCASMHTHIIQNDTHTCTVVCSIMIIISSYKMPKDTYTLYKLLC